MDAAGRVLAGLTAGSDRVSAAGQHRAQRVHGVTESVTDACRSVQLLRPEILATNQTSVIAMGLVLQSMLDQLSLMSRYARQRVQQCCLCTAIHAGAAD